MNWGKSKLIPLFQQLSPTCKHDYLWGREMRWLRKKEHNLTFLRQEFWTVQIWKSLQPDMTACGKTESHVKTVNQMTISYLSFYHWFSVVNWHGQVWFSLCFSCLVFAELLWICKWMTFTWPRKFISSAPLFFFPSLWESNDRDV